MKNKNGFIATSVMFAFFLVFIALSTLVITSYAHYDSLINALNGNILETLNEEVIKKKYTSLNNCIKDGDLSDTSFNYWKTNGSSVTGYVSRFHDDIYNNNYIRIEYNPGNATITKKLDNCVLKSGVTKKVYVSFRFTRSVFTCSSSYVKLNVGQDIVGSGYTPLCGDRPVNWGTIQSFIVDRPNITNSTNQFLKFELNSISAGQYQYLGIEDVMVVDITNLYKDSNCLNNTSCDSAMKAYLDKDLSYMESVSMPKY